MILAPGDLQYERSDEPSAVHAFTPRRMMIFEEWDFLTYTSSGSFL